MKIVHTAQCTHMNNIATALSVETRWLPAVATGARNTVDTVTSFYQVHCTCEAVPHSATHRSVWFLRSLRLYTRWGPPLQFAFTVHTTQHLCGVPSTSHTTQRHRIRVAVKENNCTKILCEYRHWTSAISLGSRCKYRSVIACKYPKRVKGTRGVLITPAYPRCSQFFPLSTISLIFVSSQEYCLAPAGPRGPYRQPALRKVQGTVLYSF